MWRVTVAWEELFTSRIRSKKARVRSGTNKSSQERTFRLAALTSNTGRESRCRVTLR
jgi:hypothetical protein